MHKLLKDITIVTVALVLTGGIAYAMKSPAAPVQTIKEVSVTVATTAPTPVVSPSEAPAPVKWQDNPNHCSDAQWIAENPPFPCIDKPVAAPPAPNQTVSSTPSSCAGYRALVSQYNWPVDTMLAIMQAESGCRADAVSPPNSDGLRDYGLFQIHGEAIMDPAANVARAYGKYTSQGLRAWTTWTSGAYLKYL